MSDDAAERRLREAFFTPLPVGAQGFASVATTGFRPRVILDLGAGAGGLGQAAACVPAWASARRVAVEVRASERRHLVRHYDEVIVADLLARRRAGLLARLAAVGPDLIISNPPFSRALEFLLFALAVLRPGGMVMFLLRQTWGDDEAAEQLLRSRPPCIELTICGRISMARPGYHCEFVGYQWLVWRAVPPRPHAPWPRLLLPRLATSQLGWLERPGTGDAAPARRIDPLQIVDLRGVLRG